MKALAMLAVLVALGLLWPLRWIWLFPIAVTIVGLLAMAAAP